MTTINLGALKRKENHINVEILDLARKVAYEITYLYGSEHFTQGMRQKILPMERLLGVPC